MSSARLELAGHGGATLAGRLLEPARQPAQALPAALLVHLDPGLAAEADALSTALAEAGVAALVLDPPARAAPSADRVAVLELEGVLGALGERAGIDADRLALVGLGSAGTLAFLAACASRRVAAAVDVGGALARAELSPAHPIQPLELALNLSCPLLVLFGADDPATTPDHAELVQRTLAAGMKSFELERVTGAGSRFLDPAAPGYHAETARAARARVVRFLREALELD